MSWDVMGREGPVMDLSFDSVKSSKSQVTAWHNGAPVPAPMPRGPLPQREAVVPGARNTMLEWTRPCTVFTVCIKTIWDWLKTSHGLQVAYMFIHSLSFIYAFIYSLIHLFVRLLLYVFFPILIWIDWNNSWSPDTEAERWVVACIVCLRLCLSLGSLCISPRFNGPSSAGRGLGPCWVPLEGKHQPTTGDEGWSGTVPAITGTLW